MNKALMAIVLLVTATLNARAQEVVLSLDEALTRAKENNHEVALATLDEEGARARYRQTNAVFLPQVQVSYAALTTNNPLNAFGFKLQQQKITANDFNPELLNAPGSTENFVTKAEWRQPLVNMDMVLMREAANASQEVYRMKTKRTVEAVTFGVQKAYAQLQLAHQAVQVWEETLRTVESARVLTQNRFDKGLLQKSDLLRVQVELASTERMLAEAKSNIQNASDQLSLMMGEQPGVIYLTDTTAEVLIAPSGIKEVPPDRSDFRAMNAAISAKEKMVRSARMSYLPKLNAFGEYLINDDDPFGFGSDAYLAGLQLSWNLFNGMVTRNRASEQLVEKKRVERQLSFEKSQAQLELAKTQRQLRDAEFALKQHGLGVSQAAESLRILENRYGQGLVTTSDLMQAQSLLAQQKLGQAQAIFNYNTTVSYLEFITTTQE